jgi:hypothetical protein
MVPETRRLVERSTLEKNHNFTIFIGLAPGPCQAAAGPAADGGLLHRRLPQLGGLGRVRHHHQLQEQGVRASAAARHQPHHQLHRG